MIVKMKPVCGRCNHIFTELEVTFFPVDTSVILDQQPHSRVLPREFHSEPWCCPKCSEPIQGLAYYTPANNIFKYKEKNYREDD